MRTALTDTNSGNISVTDTYENFHEYEIQWTPDSITWLIDGQKGRVKQRSETWNASANQWNYPQTPARLQISIWPGGAASNAQGTIDWAGGPINWNSTDIQSYGYDFATFGQIEVECYNATSPPGTSSGVSYTFNSWLATNDTVIDGDKPTVLKSFLGSGLDMNAGASSASGSSPTASATAETVPGGSSQGQGSNPGLGNDGSGSGGGGGSGTASSSSCQATGFSQDCGGSGSSSKNGGANSYERPLGASGLAIIVGFVGLLWL